LRRRLGLLSLLLAPALHAMPNSDRIDTPPVRREFPSPAGHYRLRIESLDGWRSPQPQASLARRRADGRYDTLWTRPLPHHHGPRAALVSDAGQVLLVDEWINVRSRHALVLLDATARELLHATHDQVLAALGVTLDALANQARLGPWLTRAPELTANPLHARIAAGGRVLRVELRSGALTVEP
jgi:hypothetical protein